jgi:hypothetical protein
VKLEDAARALGPPGRLSRFEKDAILARVEGSRGGWLRRHRLPLTAALSAAAAIAVALIVLVPATRREELTARGSAGVTLVVRCADRDPGECRPGDRLAFDFGSAPPAGYVALFARAASGTVIWYSPADEDSASVELSTHATQGMLDRVAVIDASYLPGTYDLFAVISPQPLSRAEIRTFAKGEHLVAPAGVHIETRTFVIREESTR